MMINKRKYLVILFTFAAVFLTGCSSGGKTAEQSNAVSAAAQETKASSSDTVSIPAEEFSEEIMLQFEGGGARAE